MVEAHNEAQKRPTGQSVAYSPSKMPHFCPKKKRDYRKNYDNPLIYLVGPLGLEPRTNGL